VGRPAGWCPEGTHTSSGGTRDDPSSAPPRPCARLGPGGGRTADHGGLLGRRLFWGGSAASDVATSPVAGETGTSPSDAPGLTDAGARSALITEADIEDAWNQVDGASGWQDSLLIGDVDVSAFLTARAEADSCQKLLDGLYHEDLLGKPAGASALTGFDQGSSRLLYQNAAYGRAGLDSSPAWLKSLPVECDQFSASGGSGGKRTVQVIEISVPEVGDDRQGLEVTVRGTADDAPVTLPLDVAVVRVGTDAITVTPCRLVSSGMGLGVV
jgi:hypothetical protein